ncbi:glycoside hydrolase superfamily, partial [Catenaria anguillulae PL171]
CSKLKPGKRVCCSKGTLKNNRPNPLPNGECFHVKLPKDGTCDALASEHDVTIDEIERWNTLKSWRWGGCAKLMPDQKVCLSDGRAPRPDPLPADKVQCGAESEGDKKCPLNACCGKWGWCGLSDDFCRAEPTLAPGLGCQSNCGTEPAPEMRQCDGTMRYAIGYYESWAETRKCMKFAPTDIHPFAYTHIHYSFAIVDSDDQLAITPGQRDQLVRMKKHFEDNRSSTKIVLSVGGWSFNNPGSTQRRFTDMSSTPQRRARFIDSAINLLSDLRLDGLDIDWEYPATPDRLGVPEDTPNYLALVREARAAFRARKPNLSLSIAAPASYWFLREFLIADMAKELDYIVYMTYDMHGNWDYKIPTLGGKINSHVDLREVANAIKLIMKAGVPSNKILMGIGFYGRSFKLANRGCTEYGCPFVDPKGIIPPPVDNYEVTAQPGPCTEAGGTLAYGEISYILEEGLYVTLWSHTLPTHMPRSLTLLYSLVCQVLGLLD